MGCYDVSRRQLGNPCPPSVFLSQKHCSALCPSWEYQERLRVVYRWFSYHKKVPRGWDHLQWGLSAVHNAQRVSFRQDKTETNETRWALCGAQNSLQVWGGCHTSRYFRHGPPRSDIAIYVCKQSTLVKICLKRGAFQNSKRIRYTIGVFTDRFSVKIASNQQQLSSMDSSLLAQPRTNQKPCEKMSVNWLRL